MSGRHPPSAALLVALAVVAAVVAGGASVALSADGDAIAGCVGARGTLRVVAPGAACDPGETAISWSQQGPAGPPGIAAADGPIGVQRLLSPGTRPAVLSAPTGKVGPALSASLSTEASATTGAITRFRAGPIDVHHPSEKVATKVGTLALPPGRWVITAKLTARAEPSPPSWAEAGTVACVLKSGPVEDEMLGTEATLSTHIARQFTVPVIVELRCVGGYFTRISAIRVTALRVAKLDAALLAP